MILRRGSGGGAAPLKRGAAAAAARPHAHIIAPSSSLCMRQHYQQHYWRIAAEPQQEASSRGGTSSSSSGSDDASARGVPPAAAPSPEAAAGQTAAGQTPTTSNNNNGGWAFASALSRRVSLDSALTEAAEAALRGCGGAAPTVAFVFASSAYGQALDLAVPLLRRLLPASVTCIVGCTGFGVAGAPAAAIAANAPPDEVEHAPAVALALGAFPGVEVRLRHVAPPDMPDGDAPPDDWAKLVGLPLAGTPSSSTGTSTSNDNFIIVADPAFTALEDLLGGLDFAYPNALKVGGLASTGRLSGARAVFCWSRDDSDGGGGDGDGEARGNDTGVKRGGAAVLALRGPLALELIIAQGCRPLSRREYSVAALAPGRRDVVTLLAEAPLGGDGGSGGSGNSSGATLAPVDALRRDLAEPLEPVSSERELAALVSNLCCGLAPDEPLLPPTSAAAGGGAGGGAGAGAGSEPPGGALTTEYLIRGMALVGGGGGGAGGGGGLAIGDALRVGQRVRFMVRDRAGAVADLEAHGLAYKRRRLAAALGGGGAGAGGPPALGALLFSCNGRGSALYGIEGYDSGRVAAYVGAPVAGFQCNGEIGSLRGSTRLHGFTAAVAVLRGGGGDDGGEGAASPEAPPPPPS